MEWGITFDVAGTGQQFNCDMTEQDNTYPINEEGKKVIAL